MKNINLIVTGGIAASKARDLYEKLSKNYNVRVVITEGGKKFMDLSNLTYLDKIFDFDFYSNNHTMGEHLQLAFSADLNIVYPATYNYIGKIAAGISDDMPSLLFAASKCLTMLFPSMNFNMYENPILEKNKQILSKLNNVLWVDPKIGKMASRHVGIGRALEPYEVKTIVDNHFEKFEKFENKKLLLNLGKTRSWIDKVRYITNASTGKMGTSIKNAAYGHFKEITTVFGDCDANMIQNENNIYVETNLQMLNEMLKYFYDANIVICSAALYDFEVKNVANEKIEKRKIKSDVLNLELTSSIDVLYELGKIKTHQFLVGFSLANNFDLKNAWVKMNEKNLDMLVVNQVSAIASQNNEINILLKKNKEVIFIDTNSKENIARSILEVIHKNI